MEALIIEGQSETPNVVFDPANNKFELSGKSFPEDPASYYEKIFNWLNEYANSPNDKTVFDFRMEYFNTASSKQILELLEKLEEIHDNGNDIQVKWFYDEMDEDMEEAGEQYAELVEVPIECISYSDE